MQKLTVKTSESFESKPREWDLFSFFGMHLQLEVILCYRLIKRNTYQSSNLFRLIVRWSNLGSSVLCLLGLGLLV